MPVVLLVMAVAILVGVVLAALGRAGEMATFASDTAPMELDEVSATDIALLRPPMSLWGYNVQATDDALRVIARSVTARDVEIATLRRELADLRRVPGNARAARTGEGPAGPGEPPGPRPQASLPGQPGQTGPPIPAGPPRQVSPPRPASPASPPGPPGQAERLAPRPQLPEPGPDG